jgi:hypothetical protein
MKNDSCCKTGFSPAHGAAQNPQNPEIDRHHLAHHVKLRPRYPNNALIAIRHFLDPIPRRIREHPRPKPRIKDKQPSTIKMLTVLFETFPGKKVLVSD